MVIQTKKPYLPLRCSCIILVGIVTRLFPPTARADVSVSSLARILMAGWLLLLMAYTRASFCTSTLRLTKHDGTSLVLSISFWRWAVSLVRTAWMACLHRTIFDTDGALLSDLEIEKGEKTQLHCRFIKYTGWPRNGWCDTFCKFSFSTSNCYSYPIKKIYKCTLYQVYSYLIFSLNFLRNYLRVNRMILPLILVNPSCILLLLQ